jgi:predicted HicB family RNase H-like nuclease
MKKKEYTQKNCTRMYILKTLNRKVRIEAARREMSVSELVNEILSKKLGTTA